jgi:hypothetical protein
MIGSNMSQMVFDEARFGPPHTAATVTRRSVRRAGALAAALWLAAGSLTHAAPPGPTAGPATTSAPVTTSAPGTTGGTAPAAAAGGPAPPPGPGATGGTSAAQPGSTSLDQEIQGLKKDVVDLNRDLFILEEELLFPANTQVAVFLSVDVGDFFALDSVQLKIDKKEVINYLYTPREVEALLKGGVQRLYLGNLKVGPHELVAFFSGKGPNDRDYQRGASLRFEKGVGAKYLELKIDDRQRKLQPEFEIKDWE